MKTMTATLVLACSALTSDAYANPANDQADLAAVRTLAETYQNAYNARDAHALAALFTEDCVYLPDRAPVAAGRRAVEASFSVQFDPTAKFYNLEIVTNQVVISGDYAFARGSDTLAGTGGDNVPAQGKWVTTFRRENGAWKILWNTFNGDG